MVKEGKCIVSVLILTFLDAQKGKFFRNDVDKYEGEFENGN